MCNKLRESVSNFLVNDLIIKCCQTIINDILFFFSKIQLNLGHLSIFCSNGSTMFLSFGYNEKTHSTILAVRMITKINPKCFAIFWLPPPI